MLRNNALINLWNIAELCLNYSYSIRIRYSPRYDSTSLPHPHRNVIIIRIVTTVGYSQTAASWQRPL